MWRLQHIAVQLFVDPSTHYGYSDLLSLFVGRLAFSQQNRYQTLLR